MELGKRIDPGRSFEASTSSELFQARRNLKEVCIAPVIVPVVGLKVSANSVRVETAEKNVHVMGMYVKFMSLLSFRRSGQGYPRIIRQGRTLCNVPCRRNWSKLIELNTPTPDYPSNIETGSSAYNQLFRLAREEGKLGRLLPTWSPAEFINLLLRGSRP